MLGDRVGDDILMLSISIDPKVDDVAKLHEYWERFGSKPGWLYLTGDYDEIDGLRGMDIVITTSARNAEEGKALLESFNFPFKK